jgi:hypothetical protein
MILFEPLHFSPWKAPLDLHTCRGVLIDLRSAFEERVVRRLLEFLSPPGDLVLSPVGARPSRREFGFLSSRGPRRP